MGQAVAAAAAAGWNWEGVLAALQAEAVKQGLPGAPAAATAAAAAGAPTMLL